jgi:truncated hemoglobin YjbI
MTNLNLPKFPTQHGYMSEKIQHAYIASAIEKGLLPKDAHRMPEVLSLTAPEETSKPIQFWQLFSVLGQEPIVGLVQRFYERVFEDELWFTSVFEKVGGINHHINTQAAMWIDVMGGGPYYHGAEFRLSFHHTHNAMALMNDKGAERWSCLMRDTLDASPDLLTQDPRVRLSINTFLDHFMSKYAAEFSFGDRDFFGQTNAVLKRRVNFMKMTTGEMEMLSEQELDEALSRYGVEISEYPTKEAKITKALML